MKPNALNAAPGLDHGLEAEAYCSWDRWKRECETLFRNTWVFAGYVHELVKAGDAIPATVGGQPILLLRDKAGQIRAFHNVCRHRCLKLVETPCNVGAMLRCPYHSWVYGLDGRLRTTPYFGGPEAQAPEGFDPAAHGLVPVRHAIWHDWIFVNLSGEAIAFDDYVAPLQRNLVDFALDKLRPVATLDLGEVKTNWKFIMENFIEPYHVQFVHSTTTDQPLNDHYTLIDETCVGSACDVSPVREAESKAAGANTLAVSARYLTLFPTFIFGRYPDQVGVYLNTPLAPDRTYQRRVIYLSEDSPAGDKEIEDLKVLWTQVHREDHAMCERLQAGRASDVAVSGGVLSPHWENSVAAFQSLVRETTH